MSRYGYSPRSLGWGEHGRQEVRFSILAEGALKYGPCSVLDVGCGFGDLSRFLRKKGFRGRYTGIDLVPGLVRVAKELDPEVDIRLATLEELSPPEGSFDFVIASGLFNARLVAETNDDYTAGLLTTMHSVARVCVCVDFLSSYVDYMQEGGWHTDPAWAFETAKGLSKRVMLRHDYMPYEFALFIFKQDQPGEDNVFEPVLAP